jgi:hypothetical protein
MAMRTGDTNDFDDALGDFDDFDDDERVVGAERSKPGEEVGVTIEHVQRDGEECAELYANGEALNDEYKKVQTKALLARVRANELTMLPLVSAAHREHEFLRPKYGGIDSIRIPATATKKGWRVPPTVEKFNKMIAQLPVGFSRYAQRGLGFRWEYRLIAEAIEESTDATSIVLEAGDGASLSGKEFILGFERFSQIRKAIDNITERARERSMTERVHFVFNELLHVADPDAFPRRQRKPKTGEIYELIQLSSRDVKRSEKDRSAAADLVRQDAPTMAKENPGALLELKSEIERVTLGELIAKFEGLIAKGSTEPVWQQFFEANPFVLSIAFPYPVILVQGQAHVGGTQVDGSGESIADFLFRQRLTGGVAIFEIKAAKTPILHADPFRHAPNKILCGAISQVLDQRSELIKNFNARSQAPGLADTHVGHVHCLVIAGSNPDTSERRRSLDLFRNATKDVAVVTFDELLEKLKAIHGLMSGAQSAQRPADSGAGETGAPLDASGSK